ncbi:hypothetical protein JW949_01130 [Candidatus Woesearchaeota archaeon]|nr:hypothetical protein [Candidatus Woesearchaeota archaeon]
MKSKKSQIQLAESIGVIVVITFLMVMGIVVYHRFRQDSIEQQIREKKEIDAVSLSNTITSLPELKCSAFSSEGVSCIDLYKIKAISGCLEKTVDEINYYHDYYYDYFYNANISVIQAYPEEKTYTIYYEEGSGKNIDQIQVPVTIYDPISETNGFGVLIIKVFN